VISVAVFTLNEELNLPHCLSSLNGKCDDVVVIDSFSTDRTGQIAADNGARFVQNQFTGFGDQRNWCLDQVEFKNSWLLILDADERVTEELWEEMIKAVQQANEKIAAFRLKRRFFWEGKWLRYANLYPSWVVRLIRIGSVRYVNRGHAETQEVNGLVGELKNDLLDENHKGLDEWRSRQCHYAHQEAVHESVLNGQPLSRIFSSDPLVRRTALKSLARTLPMRGLSYFLYSYLFRRGFLDGLVGLQFCLEKARFQAQTGKILRESRRGNLHSAKIPPQ
jgi:glycosyltransferase involved in cell wall biosynthesis